MSLVGLGRMKFGFCIWGLAMFIRALLQRSNLVNRPMGPHKALFHQHNTSQAANPGWDANLRRSNLRLALQRLGGTVSLFKLSSQVRKASQRLILAQLPCLR